MAKGKKVASMRPLDRLNQKIRRKQHRLDNFEAWCAAQKRKLERSLTELKKNRCDLQELSAQAAAEPSADIVEPVEPVVEPPAPEEELDDRMLTSSSSDQE